MAKNSSERVAMTATSPGSMSGQTTDEMRSILWGIARDPEQAATARVSACNLLLRDAREHDGGEAHACDLNKRALALMRRVSN